MEVTTSKRQKTGLVSTKKRPSTSESYYLRRMKNYSDPQRLHRYQKKKKKKLIRKSISDITPYLKNGGFRMKAGCIAKQLSECEKISSDP